MSGELKSYRVPVSLWLAGASGPATWLENCFDAVSAEAAVQTVLDRVRANYPGSMVRATGPAQPIKRKK